MFKVEKDNTFYLNDYHIDCELAVKNDKKLIIQEAEHSHKEELELYDKSSLRPEEIRVFFYDEHPIYVMIIYIIDYKDGGGRYACGSYYPISNIGVVVPHPFQNSICW